MSHPSFRPRVAVDLGGTKILAVVEGPEGPSGPFLAQHKRSTDAHRGAQAVLETIALTIDDAVAEAGLGVGDLQSLGICVPGIVHPTTGVVTDCSNLPGWNEVPLAQWFRDRYGTDALVINDARAATWAEFRTGAGKGSTHMAFVTLSTGVGAGFVIDGKLYQGARGVAGEWGEARDDQGETFERGAAGSVVSRKFGFPAEELRQRYDAGEPRAVEAFDHLVSRAGRLVGNMATIIDPDLIVVGGGLSQLGPWFLGALQERVRAEAYSLARQVPLVPAHWAGEAGVRGVLEALGDS